YALFTLRGPQPPPEAIEIVGLDEASLDRLRALPADPRAWPGPLGTCAERFERLEAIRELRSLDRIPRVLHACLVETLRARGARAIVFDIAFGDDPARAAGTDELARAIAAHGRVVLLTRARRIWTSGAEGTERPEDRLSPVHPALAGAAVATAPFTLPRTGPRIHFAWTRHPALAEPIQLPVRALEAAALPALERIAATLAWPAARDATPAQRRAALVAALLATPAERWRPVVEDEAEVRLIEGVIRAHRGPQELVLDLYGPPGTIRHRSLAEVLLEDDPPPRPLPAGTTVFVGPFDIRTALALDSFPTVFSDPRGIDVAGVELAATVFANLRDDRALRRPSEPARAGLVLAFGAAATLLLLRGTLARGLATAAALAAAYAAAVFLAFVQGRLWLPLVVPLALVLPAVLLLGQLARYLGLARWLGIFTPRPVRASALGGGDPVDGRRGPSSVTVLFTDIAGSTGLAERLGAEAFKERLDDHFTLLTRLVEAEGGEVVEFLGDGIMAYWGGRAGPSDHAARACRTALAIAATLARDNRARAARGEPPIRLRIGINTGEAVVGRLGGPERSIFTVTGDIANAAQRIEQLAKSVCRDRPTAAVLVGEATRAAAGAAFVFEGVGAFTLRGRSSAEAVFRLVGPETVEEPDEALPTASS
ncbi:MAG: adenylate/guanylate cyclase domain-containing protein, partial [Geminicoccaceae bacterium]|nr:adenylate/guanylate cyclase domain-containing protein [Geminicoccaceae bacterium]